MAEHSRDTSAGPSLHNSFLPGMRHSTRKPLLQCSPFPCLLQSTPTQSCSHPSRISQMPALHHICGSTQFCFISPLCCTVIGKANLPWSSGGDRVAFIQWRQEEMHMYLTKATLTPLGTHLLKSNSEWTHVTVQI